jgi:hypothetical protein
VNDNIEEIGGEIRIKGKEGVDFITMIIEKKHFKSRRRQSSHEW